jgi:hypothetical protein
MTSTVIIVLIGIFAIGFAIGIVAVVSAGVRREEKHFRDAQQLREQLFLMTGEVPPGGFLPGQPLDHLTWGARRLTGLTVRRVSASDSVGVDRDLRV